MSNADSFIAAPAEQPPDWDARATDLLCPLCKYNLRHLTIPRCPECGFNFSWRELLEAEENRHKYVFEHGRGQNIRTFWRTYWRTCQPRRFWNDLSPAQPVQLRRLMLFWGITTAVVALCFLGPKVNQIIQSARENYSTRASQTTLSQAEIDQLWPLPSKGLFWTRMLCARTHYYGEICEWGQVGYYWAVTFIVWPWFTLAGLLVFRISMRQAKIRPVHLLRTVIYSCDFGVLLGLALVACSTLDLRVSDGWVAMSGAIICAAVTTYRLTIAFRQYLRVHLPFATVLASQLISLLVVFLLLVQIADFSRRI
jgi:hypothetical protein